MSGRIIALFLLIASTAWGLPEVGSQAPALRLNSVSQASSGARLDLQSLRGKTVVLDFWATWCGPCVASIPHWNQLVASAEPSQVVFIAVSDESSDIIKRFTNKRAISGILLSDPKGVIFRDYAVSSRPVTIVIDRFGSIALVTTAESLTASALQAIMRR